MYKTIGILLILCLGFVNLGIPQSTDELNVQINLLENRINTISTELNQMQTELTRLKKQVNVPQSSDDTVIQPGKITTSTIPVNQEFKPLNVPATHIVLLNSDFTRKAYQKMGWNYDEYLDRVKNKLSDLEISCTVINDAILESGLTESNRLLILANARCMSQKQVQQITTFTQKGGKIFSTYMTSFRNETDQYVNDPRDYQLAELWGINWSTWHNIPPHSGCLRRVTGPEHPLWQGLPEHLRLFRYTTMQFTVKDKNSVIAVWYDDDKRTPSFSENKNAGLVLTPVGVYVGEDLFVPENINNRIVQRLIYNIIRYLLNLN